ncbi:MAG TPA: beta-galactosidase trimerization domain-containing protein, partial [Abditibacteriaceae bacterium]|nr:beta-galactosidase trimerization domain-containing protein [Abditibacteriaceae bacterium]
DVLPIGRNGQASQTGDLPTRRLFYWTGRFLSQDSSRWLAKKTAALQQEIHPGVGVYNNWNNIMGRLYTPGFGVYDTDWNPPESGVGGQDWFEYSRLRGGSLLWTEDWFDDANAPYWSYAAARLSAASSKGAGQFGAYIMGYTSGQFPGAYAKKAMALIGHGAKHLSYYCFGPAYANPGGAYADTSGMRSPHLFRDIAQANQLIGRAEDLLWPGQPAPSTVAILYPRSAQLWDLYDPAKPTQRIFAPAGVGVNYDVDYVAEVRGLFQALQNSAIQTEFIEEDDLTAKSLAQYKVIYVTEPNIPSEGQQALAAWIQNGGTLAKISNAGTADRYNEPTKILSTVGGIVEAPRDRFLTGLAFQLQPIANVTDDKGRKAPLRGVRGTMTSTGGTIEARFDDNSPAIVSNKAGAGRVVHFAFLPGLSYHFSGTLVPGQSAPIKDFSEPLRQWIISPIQAAGVKSPVQVSQILVEAPVLTSAKGSAITLLNWNDKAIANLSVRYRAPFKATRVNSGKHGDLKFQSTADGITFTLPLDAVDVIRVYG